MLIDIEGEQENIYTKCFQQLLNEIDIDLMYKKKTYEITSILQRYDMFLSKDIPNASYQIKTSGEVSIVFFRISMIRPSPSLYIAVLYP